LAALAYETYGHGNGMFKVKWRRAYGKEYFVPLVLLLCLAGYSVSNAYGFVMFPDEYTYWSYAAAVAGYDWSDITSLGMYFSYGYSLVLIPVFMLCKDAVIAYRAAVGINFGILICSFLCLARMAGRSWEDKKELTVLFSAVTVFFPGFLFCAQMTMTENLLTMLYILSGALLYEYLESNRSGVLLLLLLTMMYAYVVHMRTVGILLSGIAVLIFHMFSGQGKKSHIIWVVVIVGLLFLLSLILKEWSYSYVYGGMNGELVSENDYSGQIEKIRYIFTSAGSYDFIIGVLGKILYLGLSTYGLFYWGIYGLLKMLFSKTENPVKRKFSAYILTGVIAQIMIASIYLMNMGAMSDYTYGRYSELILPFVMIMGMITIWNLRTKIVWMVSGAIAVIHLLVVCLVVEQILNMGEVLFQECFMVGISYLYRADDFDVRTFYAEAYLFGTILQFGVMAIMLFGRSQEKRQRILPVLLVMEMILAVWADRNLLQIYKRAAYRDYCLAEKIERLYEEKDDAKIVYQYDTYPSYAGILQFMMRDIDLWAENEVTDVDENDILIFPFDDAAQNEWKDEFDHIEVYGHFTVMYNR